MGIHLSQSNKHFVIMLLNFKIIVKYSFASNGQSNFVFIDLLMSVFNFHCKQELVMVVVEEEEVHRDI